MYDFLVKIPLFAELPRADLERLCQLVTEQQIAAGDELFKEGSHGDKAYVIKDGQLEILKNTGGSEVLIAVRQSGEVIGEMSLLEAAPRFATVRARTPSTLLVIEYRHLDDLLNTSPSAAKAMLHTITARLRSTELVVRQSEKMAQLGTLTAGIAHELNNPAAAIGRGAHQLFDSFSQLQELFLKMNQLEFSASQMEKLQSLDKFARQQATVPDIMDSLDRSDREEQLEDWMASHGIADGWEFAPTLVSIGCDPDQLAGLKADFPNSQLPVILEWIIAAFTIYSLLEEIGQGTSQMSEIIKALKSYVYLDQASLQLVDIHAGLDNTLIMLRSKLKAGISVRREYAPGLPRIYALGSELNQVWTNIIDNAIDAMDQRGELILRTRQEDQWVIVEIQDNGPGIPAEIQSKIFNPFFTTKPVGKGTGMGMNISYNVIKKHAGDIRFSSQPGKTIFEVVLPVNFEIAQSSNLPQRHAAAYDDDQLLGILENTHSIAVVGISDRPDVPATTVPAYLQSVGYRIYPVNPNIDQVLGEKSYPDLFALPNPIDLVLIFRRSEFVYAIAEQAIEIGARVIWMQEGIINEDAAALAEQAGLTVIMNTCLRTTHRRLMPE